MFEIGKSQNKYFKNFNRSLPSKKTIILQSYIKGINYLLGLNLKLKYK